MRGKILASRNGPQWQVVARPGDSGNGNSKVDTIETIDDRGVPIVAFESRTTGRYVLEPECKTSEEELRKRTEVQRKGRRELVLKWTDLP